MVHCLFSALIEPSCFALSILPCNACTHLVYFRIRSYMLWVRTMVLILDGKSEHIAVVWRNKGIFRFLFRFLTGLNCNGILKQEFAFLAHLEYFLLRYKKIYSMKSLSNNSYNPLSYPQFYIMKHE